MQYGFVEIKAIFMLLLLSCKKVDLKALKIIPVWGGIVLCQLKQESFD